MTTTKILELPKEDYILTPWGNELFSLTRAKNMVVHLNFKGEEICKYPFKYNEFILHIDSSDSYIFIESKMLSLNGLSMLTVYNKQSPIPHSVHCNFICKYREKYIYLYSDKHTYVLNKDTLEIWTELQTDDDDTLYASSIIIAQSHDNKVVVEYTDSDLGIYKILVNGEEIFEGGIMPYKVVKTHGIFYQNEEFEWYYTSSEHINIHLKEIKGDHPQFGTKYILDYVDNLYILYKIKGIENI